MEPMEYKDPKQRAPRKRCGAGGHPAVGEQDPFDRRSQIPELSNLSTETGAAKSNGSPKEVLQPNGKHCSMNVIFRPVRAAINSTSNYSSLTP